MTLSDASRAGQRWQSYMDVAAEHVQLMARGDEDGERADCARRVLLTPAAWHRWEQEISTALRQVANCRSRVMQIRALRQAGFGWVHRAAPFRYLRSHRLRGERRQRLIAALHGQYVSYERAMIAEHDSYLRSVCSGSCVAHLGESVIGDQLYRDSMQRYQTLHMEYFRAFGLFACGRTWQAEATSRQALPLMKSQLSELRKALLQHPLRADWLQREADIRKPTGDTHRLPRLELVHD